MKKAAKKDPMSGYGGKGGALVASWKKDIEETKCCQLIVLPGMGVRMLMARQINEAIQKAKKEILLEAAKELDELQTFRVAHTGTFASMLRGKAKEIKIRETDA